MQKSDETCFTAMRLSAVAVLVAIVFSLVDLAPKQYCGGNFGQLSWEVPDSRLRMARKTPYSIASLAAQVFLTGICCFCWCSRTAMLCLHICGNLFVIFWIFVVFWRFLGGFPPFCRINLSVSFTSCPGSSQSANVSSLGRQGMQFSHLSDISLGQNCVEEFGCTLVGSTCLSLQNCYKAIHQWLVNRPKVRPVTTA